MTTTEFTTKLLQQPMVRYARIPWVAINKVSDLLITSLAIVFQLVMILAQFLQPGYNPLRDTISSMVWGNYGWLQTVNFYLIGFFLIILVGRLSAYLPSNAFKLASVLLYIIGFGFIVLAICPTQSPGGVKTIQAIIHGITVYIITFSFPASCFLVASSLRKENNTDFILHFTIFTGSIGLGLIVFGIYLNVVGAHWFGMLERLLLLSGLVWLEMLYLLRGINTSKIKLLVFQRVRR